jgi:hypothetical protein
MSPLDTGFNHNHFFSGRRLKRTAPFSFPLPFCPGILPTKSLADDVLNSTSNIKKPLAESSERHFGNDCVATILR